VLDISLGLASFVLVFFRRRWPLPVAVAINLMSMGSGLASGPSVLGTVSLVLAKPRPVTVKAIDAVETLFVPRSAFMKLCQQSPELAARAADRIRKELAAYLTAIEKIGPKIGSTTGHAG
jgi:CRP-like cAMP-binding protein